MFVVHRQELIDQSSETFQALGVSHGIIANGYPMNVSEKIQIASIQSVIRRINKINVPQIIILDESHHATASTWRKLLAFYPDVYVIGLTATPARMGGQGLGDIFESLIMGPSVKELISLGSLSPYRYYSPPVAADFSELKVKYGDYVQAEVALCMDKSEIIGDLIAQYNKLAPGARAVCYCASVAHSQHTADMFRLAGIFWIAKNGVLYLQKFDSIEQFIRELHDYIDYYNNRRIKAKLKGMSPVNYRIHSKKIA
ncbi:MAG: type restriction protein res subunit [Firmicutes bacterium]|nr:type restriction protein res subunit [Bacillota bacterium]